MKGCFDFLLVCFFLSSSSYAVLITESTKVLAYFREECPSDWTSLKYTDNYRGRIIKGTSDNNGIGAINPVPSSSNFQDQSKHSHSGWSMTVTFTSQQNIFGIAGNSDQDAQQDQSYSLSDSAGSMSSEHSKLPAITLNLCQYSGSSPFFLPSGIVVFLANSVSTCPVGFSNYVEAEGRFLVFGSASVNPTGVVSPAAPVTNNGWGIGDHSHSIPSFNWQPVPNYPKGTLCGSGSRDGAELKTYTWSQATGPSTSSLNLPYVQLKACRVTDGTSNNVLPHPDAIFYFDGDVCPATFRETTARTDNGALGIHPYANIVGRLIYNRYNEINSPGEIWGNGATPLSHAVGGSGTGHNSHKHTISVSNYYFPGPYMGRACVWGSSGNCGGWVYKGAYNWNFDTSLNTDALIPYKVMRACSAQAVTNSPTRLPTKLPSQLPSTNPSKAPQTSFPSRNPTLMPTEYPTTGEPSASPSLVPSTSHPTDAPTRPTITIPVPTTQFPSRGPTLSPSTLPSQMPTQSSPSLSPTNQPRFQDLCAADLPIFATFDNFFNYQASSCAQECKSSLIANIPANVEFCTRQCKAYANYSPLCKECLVQFLQCQASRCQSCFYSGEPFIARQCKECAITNCREQLTYCTGFNAQVMNLPTLSPVRDLEAEAQEVSNTSIIVGSSIGALFVAFAAMVVIRRRSLNQKADLKLENVTQQIFNKKYVKKDLVAFTDPVIDSVQAMESNVNRTSSAPGVVMNMPLRTRFSFHGDDYDELDVPAGCALVGISKNPDWWVALDERSGRVGVIPCSFVTELG